MNRQIIIIIDISDQTILKDNMNRSEYLRSKVVSGLGVSLYKLFLLSQGVETVPHQHYYGQVWGGGGVNV